jgi:hypothetical protein
VSGAAAVWQAGPGMAQVIRRLGMLAALVWLARWLAIEAASHVARVRAREAEEEGYTGDRRPPRLTSP